jgi:hypothetical protein
MGEGLGLFDFWLSRQPVSDDLAASLTKHGAILTEFIRNSDQHRPGVSLGDGALLDEKINQCVGNGEAENARFIPAGGRG